MNNSDFIVKKIELNKSGIISLLQSQPVMDTLERVAEEQIGEIETTFVGFDRCHVICKVTGGQS